MKRRRFFRRLLLTLAVWSAQAAFPALVAQIVLNQERAGSLGADVAPVLVGKPS